MKLWAEKIKDLVQGYGPNEVVFALEHWRSGPPPLSRHHGSCLRACARFGSLRRLGVVFRV